MALDGIVLHSIINELNVLKYGKVNKIYMPNKNELLFSIYADKNTYCLNIDISADNYRINLTTNNKSNPYVAPNFCMLLRKYLNNSKINNIYMKDLERIVFIEFECFNEMNDKIYRTLIIELMGKYSNVILINENNIIIDALHKFDNNSLDSVRNIMPARKYILPNTNKYNFIELDKSSFIKLCIKQNIHTLDLLLPNSFVGISKLFVQSALDILKISNTVSENSLSKLYDYINNILNTNNVICKDYKNNYTIFYEKEKENSLQINFFLDDFYYKKYEINTFNVCRNNLLKIINHTLDKIVKKLDNINNKIISCNNLEQYKIYGELLIANIYRLNTLNEFNDFVSIENYYDNNNLINIPINNNISTSQNAEKYFKKYNKMKNTLEIVNIQKKDAEQELNYIESLVYALEEANDIESINDIYNEISENILFNDNIKKYKNNQTKSHKNNVSSLDNYLRLKIDDYTILVGKNNKQNDYLTMKVANNNDYWFHTKDVHGSHVILRSNGDMPKMETIIKCAQIAAYYSKAKFSSNVLVDYTLIKYVKKPNGAVPGYVIYTNQKTLSVEPNSGILLK